MGLISRMMNRADERRRKRERAEEIASWIIMIIIIAIGYLIYREIAPLVSKPIGLFLQDLRGKR